MNAITAAVEKAQSKLFSAFEQNMTNMFDNFKRDQNNFMKELSKKILTMDEKI